ncbi:hypothetical protein C5167_032769 [Papaver somniferum]|uniref:Uncharacterized protein n=1 Tax=Papaver somniferum TaxID=3469 RepID=A0A4Y7KCF0_PAPSO|nr:hypothetical protein C5167_032769 [Papaver somniferum]
MNLKKPSWGEGLSSSENDTSSSSTAVVEELVSSLNKQRMYREVTLALKTGLRDASAEFSFLRVRGLRNLLKFLQSVAESDSSITLFSHSQSLLELQGCCLLHRGSTALAHQFNAIKVLMSILSTRGVLERGACLDAFIAIMLDSSANQMDFEACRGIEKVTKLIKDKQADENIRNSLWSRLRCGEFLLLLIGHLNSRERPPKVRVHDEIRRLLGERSASFVWAASQFGSTLDPEQRQTALHIQARISKHAGSLNPWSWRFTKSTSDRRLFK